MILAYAGTELWIVQQQVGQFRALLDEVQLGHSFDLALKFFQRDADQLAQDVTGIVKGQRLVKVAREQKVFQMFLGMVYFRFRRTLIDH